MRHTSLGCAIAAVQICFAWSAAADEPIEIQVNRSVELAVTGDYLNYREHKGTPVYTLDTDIGWSPGFAFIASDIEKTGPFGLNFARITYQFNDGGPTHQDNSTTGAHGLRRSYISDQLTNDVNAELGWAIHPRSGLLLIPLVQLEYRDWSRSLPENNLDTVEDYSFFAPGTACV